MENYNIMKIFINSLCIFLLIYSSQSFSEPRWVIYEMQISLSKQGYDLGSIDGISGKKTKIALKKFQKKSKLKITGKLDSTTKKKLGVGSNFEYLGNAAKSGNPYAQYLLAVAFDEVGNYDVAASLVKKSAEQGVKEAQSMLGFYYEKGKGGLTKNTDLAVMWVKRSVIQEDARGQYILAKYYLNGYGVKENTEQAIILLRKSSKNGSERAKDIMAKHNIPN